MKPTREEIKRRDAYWARTVMERDNHTCRQCGRGGENLCAHHIVAKAQGLKFRWDIDNGITVCHVCHDRIHRQGIV